MTILLNVSDHDQLSARLSAATKAARAGDNEAAILELKHLLETDPRHELGNGMLASIYAQIGLTDRAVHYFRQTLDYHPDNVLARFQLASLQLQKGENSAALDTLRPMLSMPDDFLAHFHSGLALVALGQMARARELLLKAADNMPVDHPLHEQLRQLLKTSE